MDFSFVRGGRPLAAWLPELVSEDRGQRIAAAEALSAMWIGAPAYDTPLEQIGLTEEDPGAQMQRFAHAVRETVEGPEFPKASFVRRLLLYLLGLQRGWQEMEKQLSFRDEKLQALEGRLIEQMLTSQDTAERERAIKRFGRLFCAALARDDQRTRESEMFEPPGTMASTVFDALDTALLEAGDLLHEMLSDRGLRYKAVKALERLGPAAAPFVPDLLERMERGHGFDGQKVLGAAARSEPALAEMLVDRLSRGSEAAQIAAARSLEVAGPAIGESLIDEAIGVLRGLVLVPESSWYARETLASLGREREDILEELLAAAAPKPPRMQTFQYGSYDAVMYERGAALVVLRCFTRFPERVVPVLVDAIDTFEEYDPDWVNQGEHERVTSSLRAFGTLAAELAPPVLARHVRQLGGDVDWDVVRLLGEIGPAAKVALPVLHELEETLRRQYLEEEADGDEPSDPLSEKDHPLMWSIRQIGGLPSHIA